MVISLLLSRKFAIGPWFCNCPQYLGLLRIDVECSPSIHDPRKMLVLPTQLLYWVLPTSDQDFVSFQPILCHPHTQIRTILFHDVQRDIPNLEFSPSHVSIGFSQIAFPIIVLPKDDRTDSAHEERLGLSLGLSNWTMIFAICVVVDESKCLDTPILEFSIICDSGLCHTPHNFCHWCFGRRIQTSRHSDFWKNNKSLPFLGFSRYWIRCLSCASQ